MIPSPPNGGGRKMRSTRELHAWSGLAATALNLAGAASASTRNVSVRGDGYQVVLDELSMPVPSQLDRPCTARPTQVRA